MNRFYVLFFASFCAFAQDQPAASPAPVEDSKPVLNVFIDRVGFLKQENYSYLEWFQMRHISGTKLSIIVPDICALAFSDVGRYRELCVGAGAELEVTKFLTVDFELYYDQATGIDGHGKAYLWPWTRIAYQFPKHLAAEVVPFPYVPLNGGSTQFVLERAKLEYTGLKNFNFGGGMGMFQDFTYTDLQKKPFVTVTVKTKHAGNFEFWIQAMPGDTFQIQYRHAIAWHSRR